jgi:hypothetical protein
MMGVRQLVITRHAVRAVKQWSQVTRRSRGFIWAGPSSAACGERAGMQCYLCCVLHSTPGQRVVHSEPGVCMPGRATGSHLPRLTPAACTSRCCCTRCGSITVTAWSITVTAWSMVCDSPNSGKHAVRGSGGPCACLGVIAAARYCCKWPTVLLSGGAGRVHL